jgi:hypothetical protein
MRKLALLLLCLTVAPVWAQSASQGLVARHTGTQLVIGTHKASLGLIPQLRSLGDGVCLHVYFDVYIGR